jgi:hypothetical protein
MLGRLLSPGAPFVVKETAATADTPAAEVLKNPLRVMDCCAMLSPSLSPIVVMGGIVNRGLAMAPGIRVKPSPRPSALTMPHVSWLSMPLFFHLRQAGVDALAAAGLVTVNSDEVLARLEGSANS